jgi:predicted phage terminase large subunit-like protein
VDPLVELDRADVADLGLFGFVRFAWPYVEPNDLIESWHLQQIATHLEAVSRGDCRRLIINVPPGMSKTRMVSVFWPAWDWITNPKRRFMCATYSTKLSHDTALANRSLLRSRWFTERWPVRLATGADDQETIEVYGNTVGGRRYSVTVGGQITGFHANIQIVDDPTNPKELGTLNLDTARAALDRTWMWWRTVMASRKSDARTFSRVIIMQRLHEEDLVGRILNEPNANEWTHLCLPMEFEPPACVTPYGGDLRTRPGELLCPDRFDDKAVDETKIEMGSQVAAAQLQQRPAPSSGNIFKRDWFRVRWLPHDRWEKLSDEQRKSGRWILRPSDDEMIETQSWDCSFKDSTQADPVGGHIWGYHEAKFLLLDRVNDQMGLPVTCKCVLAWRKKWPKAYGILIEDKANGPAVEQVLRDEVPGIIMVDPATIGGSKVGRANAIAPLAEAENIIFPDESLFSWVGPMVDSIVTFPFARHDEDVDCMTQGVLHLHGRSNVRYLDAMRKVRDGQLPTYFTRQQ